MESVKQYSRELLLAAIVLAVTLFVYPRVSSAFFNIQEPLDQFIRNTEQTQTFDLQAFWKLREFYSFGNFEYNNLGLSAKVEHLEAIDISENTLTQPQSLMTLWYNSPRAQSVDILTDASTISENVNLNHLPKGTVIVKSENIFVLETEAYVYTLSVHPVKDILQVNGFYKVPGEDEALLQRYDYSLTIAKFNK